MRKNFKPRLRFIVGEEGGSELGEAVPSNLQSYEDFTASKEPAAEQPQAPQAPAPEEGGNPAWKGLREKLDPISFKAIEADLKAMDQAANQRIASQNQPLAPWKQFAEAGINPQQLQTAYQISQRIESAPEEVYQFLGEFLQKNGRMPSTQEVEQAETDGELQPTTDPRIDQIAAQQQQFMQMIQQQQEQRQQEVAEQAAEQGLNAEIDALKQAHPELSPEDVKEVIRRAAFAATLNGAEIPTLEEAFAEFNELRTRLISTPRPGDSAPRLPSPSGGLPSVQQKSLGQIPSSEIQSNFADYLTKNR